MTSLNGVQPSEVPSLACPMWENVLCVARTRPMARAWFHEAAPPVDAPHGRCLSKAPVSAARGRRPPPPPARLFRTSLGLVVWEGVGCLAMLVLTAILIPDSSWMKKVQLFGLPDTKAKAKAWNSRPGLSTRQHPELRRTLVRDPP